MKTATKTVIFAATSTALLFGAANAYAAENVLVADDGQSRTWVFDKAQPRVSDLPAVSTRTTVVTRVEALPELIVPLNTRTEIRSETTEDLARTRDYSDSDLKNFDLVPDSPIFIGGQSSEFNTLEAQRERAAYNRSLNADPNVPVAGAGLLTRF